VIVFAEPGLSCTGVLEARGKVMRRETHPGPTSWRGGGGTLVDHQVDAERVHCRT
jgi:hypothetical protein